jgi:cytochrome c553
LFCGILEYTSRAFQASTQSIIHHDRLTAGYRRPIDVSTGIRILSSTRLISQLVVLFSLLGVNVAHAEGNAEAGKAQAAPCAACHGQDGATGLDGTYPALAGQNEKYLFRHLRMIQSGARDIPLMAGQLNGKSEQDLADIAAYYASLPGKIGQAQGDDTSINLATRLYRGGNLEKKVPACAACHSPGGEGNPPAGFPRVSGQSVEYTVAQLKAYREGLRKTDEDYGGMMRDAASALNDTEIKALADLLLGLN